MEIGKEHTDEKGKGSRLKIKRNLMVMRINPVEIESPNTSLGIGVAHMIAPTPHLPDKGRKVFSCFMTHKVSLFTHRNPIPALGKAKADVHILRFTRLGIVSAKILGA